MQTIDHRTYEEHQFSSSFILPDIFEDDENELEIEDVATTSAVRPRWRISTLIVNMFLTLREYYKVKIGPATKQTSSAASNFTSPSRI